MTVSPREWSERFLLSGCYFRPAGRRKYERRIGGFWSSGVTGRVTWDGMGWDGMSLGCLVVV